MNSIPLTIAEIRLASNRTTSLLADAGYSCCLVGSAAGYEHGISRTPNDVDILVMTTKASEELKQFLVSVDTSYYWTKPATNPNATYRVLWYRTLATGAAGSPDKSCRIDIFTPGMIHLPRIPTNVIIQSDSGPIMPFFPVLLHKIQAWKAHIASVKPWAAVKQANDICDITGLLRVARKAGVSLENHKWLDEWFVKEALSGVREYVDVHPETAHSWAELGFQVLVDTS